MGPSIFKTCMECSNQKTMGNSLDQTGIRNKDVGSRTNNPSFHPNSNELHYVTISNDPNIVDEFHAFVPWGKHL